MTTYDCIVIGGGVLGSAAGLHLAKQGHRTLVLEQFALPHSRGSSSGPSRMSHNTHFEEHHMQFTRDVQKTWKDLEEETNTVLRRKTGILRLDKVKNSPSAVKLRENMVKFNTAHQILTTTQLTEKYPLMTYKGDYSIVFEEDSVLLTANKCLQTIQDYFLRKGGELRDGEKVLKIDPGRIVTVHTSKGHQYKARGLVITPGSWASELLKPLGLDLPLKVWRVNVCFFKEKQPGSYSNYPLMIDREKEGFIYHIPSVDYPGYMKMGYHLRWNEVADPDKRDWTDSSNSKTRVDIEAVKKYVQEHYPGLEPEPAIIENCMYTCTPKEDIIIDKHPAYSNIAIGCGMSGKGFKMALWAGQLLGDLAMGKPLTYDIRPISMQRFLNPNAKL